MSNNLKEYYHSTIVADMMKKFKYHSVMEVPKITKITLNMGVGEVVNDKKVLDYAVSDMIKISGQKPVVTVARKSIAGFKIRDGWPIGVKATLRKIRMYDFLYRLVSVVLPRIRDFSGFPGNAFDDQFNYNFGIKEQIVFPEIDYDKIDALRGMNISITMNAKTLDEAKYLLRAFKFPLR